MHSNYKRLGDYIRLVDERNRNLEISNLAGLTINKNFITSVANVVGTDMSTYKIIRKNQFACSVMQVRRDKKMPVALWKKNEPGIISQAYPIFEIVDEGSLSPDYLMMWFTRSEFDREACFLAVGGVRGSLEWEDFLNMKFPLPSLEKQKEIVAEYQAVEQRILLNKKLCWKLEETAQTIYKHWFEDFEFPVENKEERTKSKESHNHQPSTTHPTYKSSGGKMVYNEELGKEIPEGWNLQPIKEIATLSAGGDRPNVFSNIKSTECRIPIYSNGVTDEGLYGFTNEAKIFKKSISISARGTIGFCVLRDEPFVPIVRLIVVIPNEDFFAKYLFDYINKFEFDDSGSVQNQLTVPQLTAFKILIPQNEIVKKYDGIIGNLIKKIKLITRQTQKFEELKSLLLGKMAVEN
ncbi:hypothetical protein CO230_08305 [Chryseobacterium sp. 6424]|uniref:restriction endonuclease subunit S n=1 Tax=Chryseobacterium sp. 6424 TaxID=2039166 RepID=UPI000EFC8183|nr:restriction endonuclease subunit S [Chryseobacterium sp. 6424]AYO58122.1 hypothetical protein CO230_08305 [Chryseobacterium sp. 6424]